MTGALLTAGWFTLGGAVASGDTRWWMATMSVTALITVLTLVDLVKRRKRCR